MTDIPEKIAQETSNTHTASLYSNGSFQGRMGLEGNQNLSIASTLALFLVGGLLGLSAWNFFHTPVKAGEGNTRIAPVSLEAFQNISLEARAAYVLDVQTKQVLFAKNEETQLPLASLTKLMLAAVVKESLSSSANLEVPASAVVRDGGSPLTVGERWNSDDLLAYTLMVSSNDGARALAMAYEEKAGKEVSSAASLGSIEHASSPAFIEEMNALSKRLGLSQTYFLNESGVDQSVEVSGAYGSAKDIANLIGHLTITYPEIFEATREEMHTFASNEFTYPSKNTNTALSHLPRVLSSKTGYTDLAGGNLAVVIDTGLSHPVAIVVLGSSKEGRFTDVEKLAWAAVEAFSAH